MAKAASTLADHAFDDQLGAGADPGDLPSAQEDDHQLGAAGVGEGAFEGGNIPTRAGCARTRIRPGHLGRLAVLQLRDGDGAGHVGEAGGPSLLRGRLPVCGRQEQLRVGQGPLAFAPGRPR